MGETAERHHASWPPTRSKGKKAHRTVVVRLVGTVELLGAEMQVGSEPLQGCPLKNNDGTRGGVPSSRRWPRGRRAHTWRRRPRRRLLPVRVARDGGHAGVSLVAGAQRAQSVHEAAESKERAQDRPLEAAAAGARATPLAGGRNERAKEGRNRRELCLQAASGRCAAHGTRPMADAAPT